MAQSTKYWKTLTTKDVKRKRSGGGKEAMVLKIKNKTAPVVTAANASTKMGKFVKFYKNNMVVPDEEWKDFLDGILTCPAMAFRIPRTHQICNSFLEAKRGAVSQADVLLEKFKAIIPYIEKQKIEGKKCEMKCLEWYPNEYAWQANFDVNQLKASDDLNPLVNFIIEETAGFNVMRQEVHTMIPPLLLDIQPDEKVLDMFSSPGWMAAQLSEEFYANPKTLPSGLLVTNDTDQTKLQWRWIQGPNMFFLHHDARYMPWLYNSREHMPENRMLFDKILCDVPCSEDGQLGKNAYNRTVWTMISAYAHHKNQKRFLQRGIELLAQDGDLLYCTSSMNPIENEAVVAAILRMSGGALELKDLHDRLLGFKARPGMSKWKIMMEGDKFGEKIMDASEAFKKDHDDSIFPPAPEEAKIFQLEKCLRVHPNDNNTAGFFCALLTRTGKLPWVSQVSDSESVEEEPPETEYKPPKPVYIKPFKYVFDVKVTEIEWNVETTNNKLETKVTSEVCPYEVPTPKLMQSSIMIPKDALTQRNNFIRPEDPVWQSVKKFYGISEDFNTKLVFMRGGMNNYHLYYHHPAVKDLHFSNKNVHSDGKLRNTGLKIFRVHKSDESPDCDLVLSEQGIMLMLPHLKKRVVKINRDDLEGLLTNKSWRIAEISDTLKASLPKETGCTVFHYSPKGKAADPKCEIVMVGWVGKNVVKCSTDQSPELVHYMRLCGIDNPNKSRKVSKLVEEEVKEEEQSEEEVEDEDDLLAD